MECLAEKPSQMLTMSKTVISSYTPLAAECPGVVLSYFNCDSFMSGYVSCISSTNLTYKLILIYLKFWIPISTMLLVDWQLLVLRSWVTGQLEGHFTTTSCPHVPYSGSDRCTASGAYLPYTACRNPSSVWNQRNVMSCCQERVILVNMFFTSHNTCKAYTYSTGDQKKKKDNFYEKKLWDRTKYHTVWYQNNIKVKKMGFFIRLKWGRGDLEISDP